MSKESIKKSLGLGDDIPFIDMSDKDFESQFDFLNWSTHSASDYRNDRERPYNGQAHTDEGERGKQMVSGLSMRDLKDCLVKAMLVSSVSEDYLKEDIFTKCWDFSTDPPTPTQFLLDHQDESEFISTKVQLGTWRTQDVCKIDLENINLMAVCQNFTCEVEKMMGIFPNLQKIENKK